MKTKNNRRSRAVALGLVLSIWTAGGARAANYVVTTTAGDLSAGSLGAALLSASLNPLNSDTITFGSLFNTPQTINLSLALTSVVKLPGASLTINAPATSPLTIVNSGALGAVTVDAGGTLNMAGLNIESTNPGGITLSAASILQVSDGGFGGSGLTLNNGTLRAAANFSSSGELAVAAGGGTLDADGHAATLSGVISGTGLLTLKDTAGGGSLALTGVNTYTGGTALTGATVGVNNAASLGTGGVTASAGTLQFLAALNLANGIALPGALTLDADGHAATLSGVISGAGILTLKDTAGGGSLALTGVNTYTGGTALTGVTVGVNNAASLGTGGVTVSAATLQVLAPLNLANGISLPGALTLNAEGRSAVISGAITGSGSLTVQDSVGGGMLMLSGANSWTGGTTISAGTLALGAANAAGAGGLSVANGAVFDLNGFSQTSLATVNNGTIDARSGVLTVSGNYGGTGTLAVAPKIGTAGLQVSGVAMLSGGTLAIEGRPLTGDYAIVNAGSVAGSFASIQLPTGDTAIAVYSSHGLQLDLTAPAPFAIAGQTLNQLGVGTALNSALSAATSDANLLLGLLGGMTSVQLNSTLDQMSPMLYASLSGISTADSGAQTASLQRRMAQLRGWDTHPDEARVDFYQTNAGAYPGTLFAEPLGDVDTIGSRPDAAPTSSRLAYFISALGTRGRQNDVSGSAGPQPGYVFEAGGAAVGVDYRFEDHFAVGVSGAYIDGTTTVDSNDGDISSRSLRYGVYGTAYGDDYHADLYVGGASDDFNSSRNMTDISRTATASPTGQEINADAQAAWDFETENLFLSPLVGMSYDRLAIGAISESGAGTADMDVAPQTDSSLRSRVGAKISHEFGSDKRFVKPYLSAAWQHEFINQSRAIDAQFASSGAGAFAVQTASTARDGALVGAGLEMDWSRFLAARIGYTGDYRADLSVNTLDLTLSLKF